MLVLSKLTEKETSQRSRNHETIYAILWTVVTMASGIVLLVAVLLLKWSPWWMLMLGVTNYFWYIIEWIIKIPQSNASHKSALSVKSMLMMKIVITW